MICGTVHEHLRLLARLVGVLHQESIRRLLANRPNKARLCDAVHKAESTFAKEEAPISK